MGEEKSFFNFNLKKILLEKKFSNHLAIFERISKYSSCRQGSSAYLSDTFPF
jgi:hypothetical protein